MDISKILPHLLCADALGYRRPAGRAHLLQVGGGVVSALYTPRDILAVVRSAVDALVSLTRRQILLGTSRDPESPAAQRVPTKRAAAMKQTLGDLMRMSRICRMVFATCLGSFILVIFYFQSMFQPGRIRLPFVSSIAMRRSYLRVDA